MKTFLQILLTLGLVAFALGVVAAFTHRVILFTPQGWWRGALAFWMLLVATKLTYFDAK